MWRQKQTEQFYIELFCNGSLNFKLGFDILDASILVCWRLFEGTKMNHSTKHLSFYSL